MSFKVREKENKTSKNCKIVSVIIRIREGPGLNRTIKIIKFQPPWLDRDIIHQVLRAPSNLTLKSSRAAFIMLSHDMKQPEILLISEVSSKMFQDGCVCVHKRVYT